MALSSDESEKASCEVWLSLQMVPFSPPGPKARVSGLGRETLTNPVTHVNQSKSALANRVDAGRVHRVGLWVVPRANVRTGPKVTRETPHLQDWMEGRDGTVQKLGQNLWPLYQKGTPWESGNW